MADIKFETVNTIAELKTLSPTVASAIKQVEVRGYYAARDGGGGTFYWDASSTSAANDGTIIQSSTTSTGRWIRVITSPYYDVRWFGARSNSANQNFATQNTTSINKAVQAAIQARAVVHGAGFFFLSDSIKVNTNATPGPTNIVEGVSIWGQPFGMPYNSIAPNGGFTLAPNDTFPVGKSILNLQYSVHSSVNHVNIDGRNKDVSGIEVRGIGATNIEHCSIHDCTNGILTYQSGLLHINYNNVSNCSNVGIGLFYYCGDSTLIGNYVNTNNPNFGSNTGEIDLYTGTGILVAYGSGNTNIIGGKVEWNSKGIMIYGSNGINVSGINFDANKQVHILIAVPDNDAGRQCKGFSIVNCRFLAGGTITPGGLDYPGNHITLLADSTDKSIRGTITGCTFRKASNAAAADDLADLNPSDGIEPIGPKFNAIKAAGSGEILVQVAGCDFKNACESPTHIIASGSKIIIDATGKSIGATKQETGGAVVTLV
jgi:hypothetical protein